MRGGFTGSEEWIGEAIIESHLSLHTKPLFRKFRTTLPYLHAWLGLPHISVDDLPDEPGIEVIVKPRVLYETDIGNGVRLRLYHSLNWKSTGHTLMLMQPVNVIITADQATGWRRFVDDWVGPFEALVWLAVARHVGIGDMWLWYQSDPDWVRLHAPVVRPDAGDSGRHELHEYELVFLADHLPGGFADGLRRWYDIWAKYSSILMPLMAMDRAPFTYTDDRFSTAVAAAEGFHSLRFGDRDVSRAEHRARVEALRKVLDSRARRLSPWIIPIAQGANRIPLGRRLDDLMSLADGTCARLAGDHRDRLVGEVEELRNGYAHGRRSESRLRSDSGARHWVAEAMKWLVRTALLLELGFSEADVAKRVGGHPNFELVSSRLQAFFSEGTTMA